MRLGALGLHGQAGRLDLTRRSRPGWWVRSWRRPSWIAPWTAKAPAPARAAAPTSARKAALFRVIILSPISRCNWDLFLLGLCRAEAPVRLLPQGGGVSRHRHGAPRHRRGCRSASGLEECEQVGVDLVLVGRAQAVRQARIDFQRGAFDDLGREHGRGADRHDLIVVAVHDERRHVELLEILGEVGLGEGLDAVEARP